MLSVSHLQHPVKLLKPALTSCWLLQAYKHNAHQLVAGVALGCEELSELYTLKDNVGEEVNDYIQGFYCFLLDRVRSSFGRLKRLGLS